MKSFIIALFLFACAVRCHGQSGSVTIAQAVHPAPAYATLSPSGDWNHDRDTDRTIIRIADTEIVIECAQMDSWLFTWGKVAFAQQPKTVKWREIYRVADGKITLVAIQHPRVTPAVAERTEWLTDTVVPAPAK